MTAEVSTRSPELVVPAVAEAAPEGWRKVLNDAADNIEQYGWAHSRWGGRGSPHCAIGAMQDSQGLLAGNPVHDPSRANADIRQAISKLRASLGFVGHSFASDVSLIASWNDTLIYKGLTPTRAGRLVVNSLRSCARSKP